jgi:alpha-amylase
MKSVCLYFQVHQPLRLRKYRFFDIGVNHNYYDDYLNRQILKRVSENSYMPMNKLLLDLMAEYGDKIKICMSVSGLAIEQLMWSAPEVLDSFKKLVNTGNVELLTETYDYSFSCLGNTDVFIEQVLKHKKLMEDVFGVTPKAFVNTEMLYSDKVGEIISSLNFNAAIIEGARHVLGWKQPEFLYCSGANPKLKLLTRNSSLSDDIAFRFAKTSWDQWPLTADKYMGWMDKALSKGECLTLGLEYETFGEHIPASSGIFDFLKDLLQRIAIREDVEMNTPSIVVKKFAPVGQLNIPFPITWADEEKDTATWLGNELQNDAFKKLYDVADKVKYCSDKEIIKDYLYLQSSDHLIYMCTKLFSDGVAARHMLTPYDSPYNAFINYMNVLSDFLCRVDEISTAEEKSKEEKSDIVKNPITWKSLLLFNSTVIKKVVKNLNNDIVVFLLNNLIGKDRTEILKAMPKLRREKLTAYANTVDADTSMIEQKRQAVVDEIINVIENS